MTPCTQESFFFVLEQLASALIFQQQRGFGLFSVQLHTIPI
jgi:hypothetical protein